MSAVSIEKAAVAPSSPAAAWHALSAARTADQLAVAWLEVLGRHLAGARAALLLRPQPDGRFAPAAVMPAGRDVQYLAEIATEALRSRAGTVQRDELGHARFAYPLQSGEALHGAVVLDLGAVDELALERAMRLTHWGAGWLIDLGHQRELAEQQGRIAQAGFLLDTLLAVQGEASAREAATMLVNRVGQQFGCQLVQLAVPRGRTLRVLALSHAAWFDERAGLVNQAVQAMHEAYDQRSRIVWPTPEAAAPAALAHARYAAEAKAAALCSLPMLAAHQVVGVLMCEREQPFDAEELACLDALALAAAPALQLRREADQGTLTRARQQARRSLLLVTGSTHAALKLGAIALALALIALGLIQAPFRISAQAAVEGSVQRAAVAPFEGFLREAPVRAGDTVKAGQVLATLDDKDVRLEKLRWESELEVAQQKEREAMAKANRVDQRLAAAQANQARAQLELAQAKLERVNVIAPFDAVVVRGDLSQQLGSPVEQGKLLFELAPLDAWRVILKVDDRDINQVHVGAKGELVLSSMPGRTWPFKVRKITPISLAEEGRTFFRVEAELGDQGPKLQPNMEGVGKITAGQRSLLWIWTHGLTDWVQLTWWKLLP